MGPGIWYGRLGLASGGRIRAAIHPAWGEATFPGG